ncbi:hypothetical protein BCR43DRAFT_219787 [Syncephalastrum racemosum]|uniref:Uncharacterized protein n=1 Tax=Syncephalastrum racemosum TaxID=13706 RepID=A0A1X2HJC7_SYNRA|nr:hypothetical protein BCR43DRAFT_219787 [Syncephalastrum racemosum]
MACPSGSTYCSLPPHLSFPFTARSSVSAFDEVRTFPKCDRAPLLTRHANLGLAVESCLHQNTPLPSFLADRHPRQISGTSSSLFVTYRSLYVYLPLVQARCNSVDVYPPLCLYAFIFCDQRPGAGVSLYDKRNRTRHFFYHISQAQKWMIDLRHPKA